MRRLKNPVASALLFLGTAVAVEGMSERRSAAAVAPPPVVPSLGFTENYKAGLKSTPAGGLAVETERLIINACIPFSSTDPAFTTASVFHLNMGRFVFNGTLGDDQRYVSGKKSARLVVASEEVCDDNGLQCRSRVYATATLKWIVGKRGKPSKVLVKVSGVRANFQDVVGAPGLDFSVLAPALWTNQLTDLEGGASADPRPLSSYFSVDSVVTLGTLSHAYFVTYTGESKPKVKTVREVVDYDPDTLRPIYGPATHFLANVSIVGTGALK
jgi:hypothetical protein